MGFRLRLRILALELLMLQPTGFESMVNFFFLSGEILRNIWANMTGVCWASQKTA